MRRRIFHTAASIGLCLLFAIPAFAQGMYWESVRSNPSKGEKAETEKFYYMPKKFKAALEEDGQIVILRLDKETMYSVRTKDKTYSEMTFAEMEGMMKQAGSQMAEAMKQLESLPEEQRKMAEQMMGGMMGKEQKVDVKKTGDRKTISGYACTKYLLTQGGKEILTIWATTDVKDFESMRKDLEEFSKRMSAMNPMMPKGVADAMKGIEGFPIQTDESDGMRQLVTKIEKRSTPASEFEVPAGYKKTKMDMMTGEEE